MERLLILESLGSPLRVPQEACEPPIKLTSHCCCCSFAFRILGLQPNSMKANVLSLAPTLHSARLWHHSWGQPERLEHRDSVSVIITSSVQGVGLSLHSSGKILPPCLLFLLTYFAHPISPLLSLCICLFFVCLPELKCKLHSPLSFQVQLSIHAQKKLCKNWLPS
jgi:hypothetical protein